MLKDIKYPTLGEELNGKGDVTFKQVELDNGGSVYRINIRVNGSTVNFYCYLSNAEGKWKISAIRKFQVPAFIYDVIDSLSMINVLPDSVESLLKSLKLITGPDEDLQKYLTGNISSFHNLISAFQNKTTNKLNELMNSLCMDYIFADENYPQCVFVLITEFGSMEAGYIYSQSKTNLPHISPERFIYIEEVAPDWYVFRAM